MARKARVRRLSIFGSALAVLIPAVGFAAPPVPLPVQPVSTRIRIESTCSPAGVSSASLSSPITAVPGLTGTLQVDASLLPSEALVTFSGSGTGSLGSVYFDVFFEADALIPQIGDAMTPVFASLEDLTESGSLWSVRSIGAAGSRLPAVPSCSPYTNKAAPDSTLLGSPLGDAWGYYSAYDLDLGPWPARTTNPLHLLPGETAHIPIKVAFQLQHAAGSGSFSDSVRLVFRSTPTTIANGDVNGDAQVNVLDTTLIRRAIAGFPNP